MASDRCLLLKKPKEMFLQALKIQKRDSYFQRSFGRKRKDLENDEMLEWDGVLLRKTSLKSGKRQNISTRQNESNVWIKLSQAHYGPVS